MAKGIIFDIDEFGVHDGPGIRKLVFFKGCPLHCTWCHNPEGISYEKESFVTRTGELKTCGEEYEAVDLAKKLRKGADILINSGGGITITGGEPLAQPDFLFDLIWHLRPLNIAVETSGFSTSSVFEKVVSSVNLVFFDVKHTDSAIHENFTGVENSLILDNLKLLCQSATDFIVRIPLIPGVTDTIENLESIAQLIKDAHHLKQVELLPYHQTAGAKYAMTGRKFEPGFDTTRKAKARSDIFKNYNIKVSVL
jgi:pyruvate formate lyase activating enzyme